MVRLKKILFFSILLFEVTTSYGQNKQKFETGPFLGATNYLGDLVEGPLNFTETRPGLGFIFKYNYKPRITLRAELAVGQIAGNDANAVNHYRVRRNLSFKSSIYDFGLLAEVSPLKFNPDRKGKKFTPYLLGGISVFHFNPKAKYQGKWHALQPLGTEGQGLAGYVQANPYALWQVSFPLGIGMKVNLNQHWNIGFETKFHKTFTDYLDDVSSVYVDNDLLRENRGDLAASLADRSGEITPGSKIAKGTGRGQPELQDWFIFTGFTFTYMLRKFDCFEF